MIWGDNRGTVPEETTHTNKTKDCIDVQQYRALYKGTLYDHHLPLPNEFTPGTYGMIGAVAFYVSLVLEDVSRAILNCRAMHRPATPGLTRGRKSIARATWVDGEPQTAQTAGT